MAGRSQPNFAEWSGVAARRDRLLGRILSGLALVQAVLFLFALQQTLITAPFEDMLQWLASYQRVRHGGDWTVYLFGLFQEHRLLWAKLLTALDAEWFGASGWPFIVVGTLSLLLVLVLLFREFRRGLPSTGSPAALAWLCPMLVLTVANAVDCSVPVNIVYPLTLAFVVAACVLMDGPAESGRKLRWRGVAAVAMAAGAGLANAIGLLAWPVLLWSAWRCRAGGRWLAVIAVLGGGYALAYLRGLALSTGGVAPPASFVAQVAKEGVYALAYLGLPISRISALRSVGEVLGAMLLAAALWAAVRYGQPSRAITRLERIATGLILFSIMSAVLAALGRSQFSAGIELPVRYTVLVTPLHVGLLALALRWIADRPDISRPSARVLAGGVAAGVLLIAQQIVGVWSADAAAVAMRTRIDRFYAGEHDPDIERLVYQAGLDKADGIVAGLRRDGLLHR